MFFVFCKLIIIDIYFALHNKYLPIPQGNIDNNTELDQNDEY